MKIRLLVLFILLIASACNAFNFAPQQEVTQPTTPVAPTIDLTVTNVWLTHSTEFQCGIGVHLTIRNNGNTDAGAFHISLHDRRQSVVGLPANTDTTLILDVTGTTMSAWMRATGTVDVDNVIAETDETNNDYDHPLPYSAVPGMESIYMCYRFQTGFPPPSPSPTPR